MVVVTQAQQLRLSPPPSTTIATILYDTTSLALALMHSDSSFSLYPNISPFSSPPHSTTDSSISNGSSISYVKSGKVSGSSSKFMNVNGEMEEKIVKRFDNLAKLKCVKLRQNSREGGVRFVAFKSKEFEDDKCSKLPLTSIKVISIHFLAHNKFLILDSIGELSLLLLSKPLSGSESSCEMKKLTPTMKIQNLAVLPDDSTRAQTIWVSDGLYTIHVIIVSDPGNENDTKDTEEKIQSLATEVIFTSEKIQEIIPLAANAILLLGQANNIFAYAIS